MQYVGSRYVPLFYDDGNGGHDWTANTIYEAFTIVTYNNNSYTSVKPVPASVGSPDNNPDYWAATGNFNAQLQDVEDALTPLQNDAAFVDYTDEMDFTVSSITGIADESKVLDKELYVKNGFVYVKIAFARLEHASVGTLVCKIPNDLAPVYDQAYTTGFASGADLSTNFPYPPAMKSGSDGSIYLGGDFRNSVGNTFYNTVYPLKANYV